MIRYPTDSKGDSAALYVNGRTSTAFMHGMDRPKKLVQPKWESQGYLRRSTGAGPAGFRASGERRPWDRSIELVTIDMDQRGQNTAVLAFFGNLLF